MVGGVPLSGPPPNDREERLLRITGAIADGAPVDWEAESERSPDLRGILRRLALIERIRKAARTHEDP